MNNTKAKKILGVIDKAQYKVIERLLESESIGISGGGLCLIGPQTVMQEYAQQLGLMDFTGVTRESSRTDEISKLLREGYYQCEDTKIIYEIGGGLKVRFFIENMTDHVMAINEKYTDLLTEHIGICKNGRGIIVRVSNDNHWNGSILFIAAVRVEEIMDIVQQMFQGYAALPNIGGAND